MFGLDYSNESPQVVKAMGAKFACRYVGYFSGYDLNTVQKQQGKCLYTGEASALLALDVDIVSNFEWYAARPSIHNSGSASASFTAGQWDAKVAHAIHIGCGGPPAAPIYFSVDYQTDGSDTPDYFKGVASTIGLQRVGAYGGYDCIKYLFDNNLITYGWQTYAWSGGKWDNRAHIHQYSNGNKTPDGGQVDFDDSVKPNFGSWRTHMSGVPTGWTDDGTTLTAPGGVQVVLGFRDYVLSHEWNPENYPLASEYAATSVEPLVNPGTGAGSRQDFRECSLGYTISRGVFVLWTGLEIQVLKSDVSTGPVTPPVGDDKAAAAKAALLAWLDS